jgi:hypothetical protein
VRFFGVDLAGQDLVRQGVHELAHSPGFDVCLASAATRSCSTPLGSVGGVMAPAQPLRPLCCPPTALSVVFDIAALTHLLLTPRGSSLVEAEVNRGDGLAGHRRKPQPCRSPEGRMARPGPFDRSLKINQILRVESYVPQAGTIHHLRTIGMQPTVASAVPIWEAQRLCV